MVFLQKIYGSEYYACECGKNPNPKQYKCHGPFDSEDMANEFGKKFVSSESVGVPSILPTNIQELIIGQKLIPKVTIDKKSNGSNGLNSAKLILNLTK